MPALNQFDYFTDIEKAFINRRGKHLLIGPMDWALIESWEEREIPLRIVLMAIDDVFDSIVKRGENAVSVRSLSYCKDSVERHYADWGRAHVGGHKIAESESNKVPADETASGLDAHIRSCESELHKLADGLPIAGTVAEILEKLDEIKKLEKAQAESELEALEAIMSRALTDSKDALLSPSVRKRLEKELSNFGSPNDVKTETQDLLYRKIIREELGIPSLSLYQL